MDRDADRGPFVTWNLPNVAGNRTTKVIPRTARRATFRPNHDMVTPRRSECYLFEPANSPKVADLHCDLAFGITLIRQGFGRSHCSSPVPAF